MAGTVVDEGNVVYKTLQAVLGNGGIEVTLGQVLEDGAGKEKSEAIFDIASKYGAVKGKAAIDAMYQEFMKRLKQAYTELHVAPFDGAEPLFDELHCMGVCRVLNTGYDRPTALQLLSKLGWRKDVHYEALITASDVGRARPHPDMILRAMELSGIHDVRTVVKVGDSTIDIYEGKNAGCGLTVGITTGAQTRDQLAASQPDIIIDSLRELLPILMSVKSTPKK